MSTKIKKGHQKCLQKNWRSVNEKKKGLKKLLQEEKMTTKMSTNRKKGLKKT